jgi:hypothetical protein
MLALLSFRLLFLAVFQCICDASQLLDQGIKSVEEEVDSIRDVVAHL